MCRQCESEGARADGNGTLLVEERERVADLDDRITRALHGLWVPADADRAELAERINRARVVLQGCPTRYTCHRCGRGAVVGQKCPFCAQQLTP